MKKIVSVALGLIFLYLIFINIDTRAAQPGGGELPVCPTPAPTATRRPPFQGEATAGETLTHTINLPYVENGTTCVPPPTATLIAPPCARPEDCPTPTPTRVSIP